MSTTKHYDRLLNQHYLSLSPSELARKKEDIRLCLVLVRLTRLKLSGLIMSKLLVADVESATKATQATLKSYDMKLQGKHPEEDRQCINKELRKESKFDSLCNILDYSFKLSDDVRPGMEALRDELESFIQQIYYRLQSNDGIDINKYRQLIRFMKAELNLESQGKPCCISCEGSIIQFTANVNTP